MTVTHSKKYKRFADMALEMADYSTMAHKHGCVAVMNGRICSKGCNHLRSKYLGTIHTCCHGEVAAAMEAQRSLGLFRGMRKRRGTKKSK
jgi:hypothetical protein